MGEIHDWDRESRGIEPVGQAHLAEVRVNRQSEEQFNKEHGLEDRGDTREEWTNLKLWEKDGNFKSSLEYQNKMSLLDQDHTF